MATPRRARLQTTEGGSTVTKLELFFDLVFVFALTQVTALMAAETSGTGLFRGALILAVLWWCWIGYSWLTNVVRADEGVMRVGMFLAMGVMFVAAVTIPESFDDLPGGLSGPVVFAACYFAFRLIHIGIFLLASRDDPGLRRQVVRFAAPMTFGTVMLLIASQTTGALQIALWCVAIIGDFGGTVLSGTDWKLASPAHFAERYGLIVIVALGESIVATGIGIAQEPISWQIVGASSLALTVSAALWWSYFDVTALLTERAFAATQGVQRILLARNGYTFLHLPMIIGIILMSLGLKTVLGYVAGYDDHTLTDPIYGLPLVALYGGAALFLAAHAWFTWMVAREIKRERLAVVVVLLVLIPAVWTLPAIATLGVLALVLVAMIGWETYRYAEQRQRIRHAEGH